MSLLSGSVQPHLLTLLSSTSQPGLSPLFRVVTDHDHPESLIDVVPDAEPHDLVNDQRGSLFHNVIHLQSPTIARTYIQAGVSRAVQKATSAGMMEKPLGIELPWLGIQFRPLGTRPFSFEIGVMDPKGREGIIRVSSFKHEPSIHLDRKTPLVHLPLSLPSQTTSTLTSWCHLNLDLSTLLQLFVTLPRPSRPHDSAKKRKVERQELPSGSLASISYIRIYANCRIRRVWFSEAGERTLDLMDRAGREEWGLYAAAGPGE